MISNGRRRGPRRVRRICSSSARLPRGPVSTSPCSARPRSLLVSHPTTVRSTSLTTSSETLVPVSVGLPDKPSTPRSPPRAAGSREERRPFVARFSVLRFPHRDKEPFVTTIASGDATRPGYFLERRRITLPVGNRDEDRRGRARPETGPGWWVALAPAVAAPRYAQFLASRPTTERQEPEIRGGRLSARSTKELQVRVERTRVLGSGRGGCSPGRTKMGSFVEVVHRALLHPPELRVDCSSSTHGSRSATYVARN